MKRRSGAAAVARTTLAMLCAFALLRCSLLVDTASLAGAPAAAEAATPDGASLEASVDAADAADAADAGNPNRGDAAVWPVNGHAYLPVGTSIPISWPDAKAAAEAKGGHLATLTSVEENAFVYTLIRDRNELFDEPTSGLGPWLGGTRPDKTGAATLGWVWVTGEPWQYTSWGPGQPDDRNADEDSLHFYANPDRSHATWNDAEFNAPYVRSYIIEFE